MDSYRYYKPDLIQMQNIAQTDKLWFINGPQEKYKWKISSYGKWINGFSAMTQEKVKNIKN